MTTVPPSPTDEGLLQYVAKALKNAPVYHALSPEEMYNIEAKAAIACVRAYDRDHATAGATGAPKFRIVVCGDLTAKQAQEMADALCDAYEKAWPPPGIAAPPSPCNATVAASALTRADIAANMRRLRAEGSAGGGLENYVTFGDEPATVAAGLSAQSRDVVTQALALLEFQSPEVTSEQINAVRAEIAALPVKP